MKWPDVSWTKISHRLCRNSSLFNTFETKGSNAICLIPRYSSLQDICWLPTSHENSGANAICLTETPFLWSARQEFPITHLLFNLRHGFCQEAVAGGTVCGRIPVHTFFGAAREFPVVRRPGSPSTIWNCWTSEALPAMRNLLAHQLNKSFQNRFYSTCCNLRPEFWRMSWV